MTDVTSAGAGFSTATVSTTGAIGCCFTFRAVFFTDARLGLALATVRFAVLATLRALLRLAEFALGSLARLCTFDPFLRLAMIGPPGLVGVRHKLPPGHGRSNDKWKSEQLIQRVFKSSWCRACRSDECRLTAVTAP